MDTFLRFYEYLRQFPVGWQGKIVIIFQLFGRIVLIFIHKNKANSIRILDFRHCFNGVSLFCQRFTLDVHPGHSVSGIAVCGEEMRAYSVNGF